MKTLLWCARFRFMPGIKPIQRAEAGLKNQNNYRQQLFAVAAVQSPRLRDYPESDVLKRRVSGHNSS